MKGVGRNMSENRRSGVSVKEKLNLLFMVIIICRLAVALLSRPPYPTVLCALAYGDVDGPRGYQDSNYAGENQSSQLPLVTKLSPKT